MIIRYKFIILAMMVFCHIVDDFYLQGVLAQLKCKEFWEGTHPRYNEDYKMALFAHGFSWSFVMSLPLLVCALITKSGEALTVILCGYVINTCWHVIIDDLKANQKKINLITDQSLHLIQVILFWVLAVNSINW